MARVKGGVVSRKRRKRILKLAKGYYGAKHILFRTAKEQVMNSYYYAYRDRRQKKRDFRKLWITRINAAARMNGLSYSQLMHGSKRIQEFVLFMVLELFRGIVGKQVGGLVLKDLGILGWK